MTAKPILLILLALAGCASASGGYHPPAWTREYCQSQDWERLGMSDAARFEDREKRFAALEQACGIHMKLDREGYMRGFEAGS